MKSNQILIIAVIGVAAYVLTKKGSGGGGSEETGKYGTKSELAYKIIQKYSNSVSFDATYAGLMTQPYVVLVGIYEGTIH